MCLKTTWWPLQEVCPLSDYQSAYRQSYSCEMALVKLVNDLLWNMENSQVTIFVAIICQWPLTPLIMGTFTCSSVSFWCDKSSKKIIWKLSPRQFKVNIGKAYAEPIDLEFSVPQGNCVWTQFILVCQYHHTGSTQTPRPPLICRWLWGQRKF